MTRQSKKEQKGALLTCISPRIIRDHAYSWAHGPARLTHTAVARFYGDDRRNFQQLVSVRHVPVLLLLSLLLMMWWLVAGHRPVSAATTSPLKTVFVIMLENHNWSSIAGNTTEAPYLNSLISGANDAHTSYATQYYNPPNNHPSLPNYLWLEAGTNCFSDTGCVTDDNPPSSHATSSSAHLVDLLQNSGISWKGYMESMPVTNPPTCPLADSYPYAVRHDPFVYFNDVTANRSASATTCTSHIVPYSQLSTDLQNNTVARYSFITPNVCDDMHDSCATTNDAIKQGDTWLSKAVPTILSSSAYKTGGALFITWDEGVNGDGPIGMIVVSPSAKGHGYANSIHYTHSSLLRSVEEILGVAPLLGNAASAPDLSDLFSSSISAAPTSTATSTLTAVPSPTASSTVPIALTKTPMPTISPTNTPSPTSTSVPAPTSTSTPLPPITSTLFSDNFEADAIGSVPAGWSVIGTNAGFTVQQNGSHVYDHNGWTAITTAGSPSWTDYSYSVSMLPNNWASEADGLLFRVQDSQNYYFLRYAGGTTLSVTKVINNSSATLATTSLTMSASSWHTVRVDLRGSTFTVWVDGTQELTATDATFSSGGIGIAANSPAQFDNVLVTG